MCYKEIQFILDLWKLISNPFLFSCNVSRCNVHSIPPPSVLTVIYQCLGTEINVSLIQIPNQQLREESIKVLYSVSWKHILFYHLHNYYNMLIHAKVILTESPDSALTKFWCFSSVLWFCFLSGGAVGHWMYDAVTVISRTLHHVFFNNFMI